MKSVHRRQGPLAARGQEGQRHSPLQGPWGPEGELHGGYEAEVKGGDGLGQGDRWRLGDKGLRALPKQGGGRGGAKGGAEGAEGLNLAVRGFAQA